MAWTTAVVTINFSRTIIYDISTTKMAKTLASVALDLLIKKKRLSYKTRLWSIVIVPRRLCPNPSHAKQKKEVCWSISYKKKKSIPRHQCKWGFPMTAWHTLRSSSAYSLGHDDMSCPKSPHRRQILELWKLSWHFSGQFFAMWPLLLQI